MALFGPGPFCCSKGRTKIPNSENDGGDLQIGTTDFRFHAISCNPTPTIRHQKLESQDLVLGLAEQFYHFMFLILKPVTPKSRIIRVVSIGTNLPIPAPDQKIGFYLTLSRTSDLVQRHTFFTTTQLEPNAAVGLFRAELMI